MVNTHESVASTGLYNSHDDGPDRQAKCDDEWISMDYLFGLRHGRLEIRCWISIQPMDAPTRRGLGRRQNL